MPPKKKDQDNTKIILRTYEASDLEAVRALHTTTCYYGLVPEGIRAKLWSPITWLIWFCGYTLLLMTIPALVLGDPDATLDKERWSPFILKMVLSALWAAIGFSLVYIKTERVDVARQVDDALANDLSNPEEYYLPWMTDENGVKVPRPQEVPAHFWVLTVNGVVCGMLGMIAYADRVRDKRDTAQLKLPWWKRVLGGSKPDAYFAEPTEPKTAILQRWAIAYEYQTLGLSSLMLERAMKWAKENDIDYVFAGTNETHMAAEQILTRRHGFQMVNKRRNMFGHVATLVCNVQTWIEEYGSKSKGVYKKVKK